MRKGGQIVGWTAVFLLTFSMAARLSNPALRAVSTADTNGFYIWRVVGKTDEGYHYGNWKTVDSVVIDKDGDTLDVTFPAPKECGDMITGDVQVSRSDLEAAIGEEGNQSGECLITSAVQVKKEKMAAGTYHLKERPVYRCWKIAQQKYERIGGRTITVGKPVYCSLQKLSYIEKTVE